VSVHGGVQARLRSGRRANAAILSILLAMIAMPVTNSSAADPVTFRNGNGLCLGVSGASLTEGAEVVQWTCNGGPDQSWVPVTVIKKAVFKFRNLNSNMCLGVEGGSTAKGANVVQWPCIDHTDQDWDTIGTDLVNNPTAFCLGITSAETFPGARAITWTCTNGADQTWSH